MLLGVRVRGQEQKAIHSSRAVWEMVYGQSTSFANPALPWGAADDYLALKDATRHTCSHRCIHHLQTCNRTVIPHLDSSLINPGPHSLHLRESCSIIMNFACLTMLICHFDSEIWHISALNLRSFLNHLDLSYASIWSRAHRKRL